MILLLKNVILLNLQLQPHVTTQQRRMDQEYADAQQGQLVHSGMELLKHVIRVSQDVHRALDQGQLIAETVLQIQPSMEQTVFAVGITISTLTLEFLESVKFAMKDVQSALVL